MSGWQEYLRITLPDPGLCSLRREVALHRLALWLLAGALGLHLIWEHFSPLGEH